MSLTVILFLLAATGVAQSAPRCAPCVKDVPISYEGTGGSHGGMDHSKMDHGGITGSTHELTFNKNGGKTLWITAPLYDDVVEVAMDGAQKIHAMPKGSMPHGIAFDAKGQLYVSLEGGRAIARVDAKTGKIAAQFAADADPHGLGIARNGKTVWFTGKTQNTVGRLLGDGNVLNYKLPTPDALPIYIVAGPDGAMWFTELTGNKIGRVGDDGVVTEHAIPTPNSRPIAIVPDPSAQALWFSEEAGNRVGRIDIQGNIIEFEVPKPQANVILAGLAFDADGNLWVQQYVDQNNPQPAGADHIIRIGKSILNAKPGDKLDFLSLQVPTRQTVMHRIVQGPDMNMWFTELKADRFGKVDLQGMAK